MRGIKTYWVTRLGHDGEAGQVIHQHVVAKECATVGQQHLMVTRSLDLADRILHVPRAHELALFPEVLSLEKEEVDQDRLIPVLEKALSEAASALIGQRTEEGQRLSRDILSKLTQLSAITEKIRQRSPGVLEDYRQRLNNRLEEIHNGKEFDQQRFFTEVALFAERCSVDEEIVRLESHIQAFIDNLQKNEVIGRKLDFLLQEMNREVNTISVKSNDLETSHLVVDAKSEIEKIREQVQNIE